MAESPWASDPSLTMQRSKQMDRAEAFAILKEAAVEVLAVDPSAVTEEARFKEDHDADSLDLVEFVMALEERFDISVLEDRVGRRVDGGKHHELRHVVPAGALRLPGEGLRPGRVPRAEGGPPGRP